MTQAMGLDQIQEALHRGAFSIPDEHGFHHPIMAACPHDGHGALVYRTEKSSEGISRVVFRCPVCTAQFDAPPDRMFVRK